jgi:hypothetical protein
MPDSPSAHSICIANTLYSLNFLFGRDRAKAVPQDIFPNFPSLLIHRVPSSVSGQLFTYPLISLCCSCHCISILGPSAECHISVMSFFISPCKYALLWIAALGIMFSPSCSGNRVNILLTIKRYLNSQNCSWDLIKSSLLDSMIPLLQSYLSRHYIHTILWTTWIKTTVHYNPEPSLLMSYEQTQPSQSISHRKSSFLKGYKINPNPAKVEARMLVWAMISS